MLDGEELYFGGPNPVRITQCGPDSAYLFMLTPHAPGYRLEGRAAHDRMRDELAPYGGSVAWIRDTMTYDHFVNNRPLASLVQPRPWSVGRSGGPRRRRGPRDHPAPRVRGRPRGRGRAGPRRRAGGSRPRSGAVPDGVRRWAVRALPGRGRELVRHRRGPAARRPAAGDRPPHAGRDASSRGRDLSLRATARNRGRRQFPEDGV